MGDLQHQISIRTSVWPEPTRIGAGKRTRPLEFGSRCIFFYINTLSWKNVPVRDTDGC